MTIRTGNWRAVLKAALGDMAPKPKPRRRSFPFRADLWDAYDVATYRPYGSEDEILRRMEREAGP